LVILPEIERFVDRFFRCWRQGGMGFMKSDSGKNGSMSFGSGFESGLNEHLSSPDQVAIVWTGTDEVVTALPVPGKQPGSYEMDLGRLLADFNFAAALKLKREREFNLPPFSGKTLFSTVVPEFSERTRILALDGDTLALDDTDLTDWLIAAEEQIKLGTDNHPLFETALEDTACSVVRLPNGQVAMTEVPRPHVNASRERIEMLLGEEEDYIRNISVETPLRCVTRYFLNAMPEGEDTLRRGKETEITALLLITRGGFSYGLWCPADGLFSEHAFLAPKEVSDERIRQLSELEESNPAIERAVKGYIKHVFDQLYLQLSPERLQQMSLASYAQLVWVTEPDLERRIVPFADEYAAKTGLDLIQIGIPADEAIAGGLLFGSFDFGNDSIVGADLIPRVDLARDLLAAANREDFERLNLEDLTAKKRYGQTVFAIIAAPVMALALVLGIVANNVRAYVSAVVRDELAAAKTLEMKPKVDLRNSYEANLKWYQEFVTQIGRLRRQQPVGIGLQYELNSRFPLDIDPSFYVSELKLLPNGGVEIKGLARNKDAVTTFLKALESAGGAKSGTRLFGSLTYEVQEGAAAIPGGQANLPTIGKSSLVNNLAPGVVAWSIRGNYLPMAEFVPPELKPTPTPQPPAPAATPVGSIPSPAR
jgi:hypothetical protein